MSRTKAELKTDVKTEKKEDVEQKSETKPKVKTILKTEERCIHITEKGERCKLKKNNDDFCHIHGKKPDEKKVLTSKNNSPTGKK